MQRLMPLNATILLAVFIFISGCGDIGGAGQCGGAATSGTCVIITDIAPMYLGAINTQVDAVQSSCLEADGTTTKTEVDQDDHTVSITFSNVPLQGSTAPLATLNEYTISYTLNSCPESATCPAIEQLTFTPGDQFTILPDATRIKTFPLMTLDKKVKYVADGATLTSFPLYTATYTFNGTTQNNERLSVRGTATFSIGEYNNCK